MSSIETLNHKSKELNSNHKNLNQLNKDYSEFIDEVAIVSRTDSNGNITYVNDKFCEVSGYSKEELIGKKHTILKHPNNSKELYSNLWDSIKAGKKWNGVIRNRDKSGEDYYENTTILPVFSDEDKNEIVEYVAIKFLVTNEEMMKSRLKKYIRSQKYEKIQSEKELDTLVQERSKELLEEEQQRVEKLNELLNDMIMQLSDMRLKKDKKAKLAILKDEEIVSLKKQLDDEKTKSKTALLSVKRERIELLQKVEKTEKNHKFISEKLQKAQESITVLQGYIDEYRTKIDNLNEVIDENEKEIAKLKKK